MSRQTPPPKAWPRCSTCSCATGQDACGDPVRVGLSDRVGVIRYHPMHGEGCQAWAEVGKPKSGNLTGLETVASRRAQPHGGDRKSDQAVILPLDTVASRSRLSVLP